MPWYKGNIPSRWETALERKTGAKFAVEVVLDPDGAAVTLDGDHDIADISEIAQERDLDIDAGGMALIPDVALTFNDLDNYFDPANTASPFHQCEGTLSEAAAAGATTIKLLSWPGVSFAADEVLTISDQTNSEEVIVAAFIADVSSGYHTLVIDAPGLINAFATGCRIHTAPIAGKEILVKLINLTEATTETLPLFRGEIVRAPETSPGQARINCADARKRQLDTKLVGADSSASLKLMCVGTDGTLASSIKWGNEFNVPPLTYSISDGALPAGLALDPATGVISGTPAIAGGSSFTVKVQNANGDSKTQVCTLVIYTRINTEFDAGLGLTAYFQKDYDEDWYWRLTEPSIVGGALRLGVSSRNADQICWHPDTIDPYYQAFVFISPGTLSGNWCLLTRINAASMPSLAQLYCGIGVRLSNGYGYVTGFNRANNRAGSYDSYNVNNFGSATGVASDLLFRIRRVSTTYYFDYRAPAGSWTSLGTKTSALAVQSIGAFFVTDDYMVTTSITGSVDYDYMRVYIGALAIDTTSLPASRAGDSYNFTLKATGGAGEYVWDVSTGTLPAGLSLNPSTGVITGIVTEDGTTSFTIRVTDGTGATATAAVSIVADSEKELLPDVFPWGEASTAYSEGVRIYVGGGLDRSLVMVGERCPLGMWRFKWTSATAFEVTPPGMGKYTGVITGELSIANVLTIPAAAWSAGMAKDDEMTFITGISWENENPVQIIYDLMTTKVGMLYKQLDASSFFGEKEIGNLYEDVSAGATSIKVATDVFLPISAAIGLWIDDGVNTEYNIIDAVPIADSFPPCVTLSLISDLANGYGTDASVRLALASVLETGHSYDDEYEYCRNADILISLTLDRDMTAAQAIEAICQHANMIQYHSFGLECLHAMRPRLQAATQGLTASEIKQGAGTETLEIVNVVTVKYAYDYFLQAYQGSYTYPPSASENPSFRKYGKEVEKTIYLPGVYDDEQAQLAAMRKYEQYADGLQLATINLDLRALLMRMGEQWDIDVDDPDVVGRYETIKKSISALSPRNVALTGYNSAIFEKFAMPDAALADVHCAW